jgi:hypothetical protein
MSPEINGEFKGRVSATLEDVRCDIHELKELLGKHIKDEQEQLRCLQSSVFQLQLWRAQVLGGAAVISLAASILVTLVIEFFRR